MEIVKESKSENRIIRLVDYSNDFQFDTPQPRYMVMVLIPNLKDKVWFVYHQENFWTYSKAKNHYHAMCTSAAIPSCWERA